MVIWNALTFEACKYAMYYNDTLCLESTTTIISLIFQVNILLLIVLGLATWYDTDPLCLCKHAGARHDKGILASAIYITRLKKLYNSQVSIPIVLFPSWISHERSYMPRHTINIIVELRFLSHCIAVEMLMMIRCLLSLEVSTQILGTMVGINAFSLPTWQLL